MDIAALVRQILAQEALNQEELARELGVEQATVSRWLKGSQPRGDTRDRLFEYAQKIGLMRSGRRPPTPQIEVARFTEVPIISWVSAGRLVDSNAAIPNHDVPKIQIADIPQGDYFGLKVSGSSMDRISPDGSIIIVNARERSLQVGKPFVFGIRGEITFKLWRDHPPRLEPYSTDPSNIPIFPDKRHKLHVIGRVRRTILDL